MNFKPSSAGVFTDKCYLAKPECLDFQVGSRSRKFTWWSFASAAGTLTCHCVSCLHSCWASCLTMLSHSLLLTHLLTQIFPPRSRLLKAWAVCTPASPMLFPPKIRICAAFVPSRHRRLHCKLWLGCVFACVTSISQKYLFTKLLIHQKGAGSVPFYDSHRPLADAVFKKTIMSFLSCWFGRGLSLNHSLLFEGRDRILNAIFKFHFLPKRKGRPPADLF